MTFQQIKEQAIKATQKTCKALTIIRDGDNFMATTHEEAVASGRQILFSTHAYMPSKKVTFIIPAYNEIARLPDTIKSIYATCNRDDFSIIIVQDGSTDWVAQGWRRTHPEITMLWNTQRNGVGYSFDKGVEAALTEHLFLMGADIRFSGDWLPGFLKTVQEHDKSFICTRVAQLNKKHPSFVMKEGRPHHGKQKLGMYRGATCLYRNEKKFLNDKVKEPYRAMIEAQWKKAEAESGVEQIGCILGAFYGVHKSWYQKVNGFKGHKQWGTLEPLISIRSYLYGGDCLIDHDTTVGHLFAAVGSEKEVPLLIFNKLLTADLLLPKQRDEVINWARSLGVDGSEAMKIYDHDQTAQQLKEEYQETIYKLHHSTARSRLRKTGILV